MIDNNVVLLMENEVLQMDNDIKNNTHLFILPN